MFEDITEACRAVASQLNDTNSMVSVPHFSLLDSMSAVELMDTKMDQCYGLSGKISINEENLLNPILPAVITIDHINQIFKKLVSYEVAFYDGASVLESTHHCVYLWDKSWHHLECRIADPSTSKDEKLFIKCLLTYSQSLHVSLWNTSRYVLESDIYEDEDFVPQVSPWVGPPTGLLESSKATLMSIIEEIQAATADTSCKESRAAHDLLLHLLQLRYSLHCLLDSTNIYSQSALRFGKNMRRLASKSSNSYLNVNQDPDTIKASVMQERGRLSDIRSKYSTFEDDCTNALQIIKNKTIQNLMNAKLGSNDDDDDTAAADCGKIQQPDVNWAFSEPLVKSQQTTPARLITVFSFSDSIRYLDTIISEISHIGQIYKEMNKFAITCSDGSGAVLTYDYLLTVTLRLSEKKFNILARSLHLCNINVITSECMNDIIMNSMRAWGIPSMLVNGDLVKLNWIPETLVKTFYDSLKCLCICRNKLLVKTDTLLSSWAIVIGEAEQIDHEFRQELGIDSADSRQHWITCWTLASLTQLMDLHLCLMMESNLLSMNEIDYYYWYLDHVCSARVYAQDTLLGLSSELQVQSYKDELTAYMNEVKKVGITNVKLPKPVKPRALAGAEGGPPSASMLILRGRKELCRGLLRTVVAMSKRDSCLYARNTHKMDNPHMTWGWRFIQRFRAFQNLSNPPMLSYETFVETITNEGETRSSDTTIKDGKDDDKHHKFISNVIDAAADCFKTAKIIFDYARKINIADLPSCNLTADDTYAVEDAPKLLKVAVIASVQCAQMSIAIKGNDASLQGTKKLTLDSKIHNHFPSMKLV